MLASCTLPFSFINPEPSPPVLELSGETCRVEYNSNSYTASITHILQGITTISFTEPEEIAGVVYSFSGNGCDIMLGDLSFKTERSFMGTNSLPQIINDIFASAKQEDALAFIERDEPKASTLTTATFGGKTDSFNYTIITDFESGYIKEICVDDLDLTVKFSNK